MSKKIPSIMIAGTSSGSGKTIVTLGLMAALVRRGLTVQPFKCGPDFIDPSLHKMVTGRESFNLDPRMCGEDYVKRSFSYNSCNSDISVIEGVMGLFDGEKSSPAYIAGLLGVPVILVVDVRSAAESVAAVIKGFEEYDKTIDLKGVILNRVGSDRHLEIIVSAIKMHCRTEVLGHLPRSPEFTIPERHLGLHMGHENSSLSGLVETLAAHMEACIDCGRIIFLAQESGARKVGEWNAINKVRQDKVRIAVAYDRAFCFYYKDNLNLLESSGAEIVSFSPISDRSIPEGVSGIYLGGGYPELFAEELSANFSILSQIRDFAESDMPVYAECGGFMYLTEGITDQDGEFYGLVGLYPVRSHMTKKLAALGYREATLNRETILGKAGQSLKGHEYHYSVTDIMPDSVARAYNPYDKSGEGFLIKNTLAGYLHLHFGINPMIAENFVNFCRRHGHGR